MEDSQVMLGALARLEAQRRGQRIGESFRNYVCRRFEELAAQESDTERERR